VFNLTALLRKLSLILCFILLFTTSCFSEDAVFDDELNIMEAQPTFSGAEVDANVFGDLKSEGPVSFKEIEDVDLRYKADVLYNLGFMNCYSDGTFRPDIKISKGDFICFVLSMLNCQFEVSETDMYTSAVQTAYALGIVVGDENNRVNPDEYLSYIDATVILARALGYENFAKLNGGYPVGYLSAVKKMGLYQSESQALTRADVCNLLYSASKTKLMERIVYGSEAQYEIDDNETVLSCYHDIYRFEDRVNATFISALPGYKKTNSDVITVGDNDFFVEDKSYSDMLGYYVDVYYTDKSGVAEIVYMHKSRNIEILTIKADDIQSFSDLRYKYYDNNKIKECSVLSHHALIINGIVAEVYNDSDFCPVNGEVKLLSYKNRGYDVVIVESFYPFVLDSVNTDEEGNPQFKSKYSLPLYKLDLNSDTSFNLYVNDSKCGFYSEKIETFDPDGNAIVQYQLPSLPKDCVVNIFADKYEIINGAYLPSKDASVVTFKIYTGREISGRVETDSKDRLKIDGKFYEKAVFDLFEQSTERLKTGFEGRFFLDYDGRICAFISDGDNTKLKYAYLINAAKDTKSLDSKAVAKLLFESGKIDKLYFSEKVKINGEKVTDAYDVITKLKESAALISDGTGFTISQLIRYKCNSDNEIIEIETVLQSVGVPSGTDENHLHREDVRKSYASRSENGNSLYFNSGNYSGMLAYNGKPGIHFRVPDTETFNDSDYMVSLSWGVNMSVKSLDVYNCSNNLVPEVVVEYRQVDSALDYPYVLVESAGQGIDEAGNTVGLLTCVTGHTNTGWLLEDGKETYYSYDTELFSGLKCGDFIYLYGTGKYISNYDMVMPLETVKSFDMSTLPTAATTSQKYDLYELYAIWESYNFILQRGPVISGTKREYQQVNYFNKLVDYGGFVYDCTGREPQVSALYSNNIMNQAVNCGNEKASRVYIWESSTVTKLMVVYIGI